MRAWALHEQGWKQKDIAAALGGTEGAVSQWVSRGKAQGPEALRHHPSPGASPKLRPEQLKQLPGLLAWGAGTFGFRGQVWTAARVAQVIKRECGLSLGDMLEIGGHNAPAKPAFEPGHAMIGTAAQPVVTP